MPRPLKRPLHLRFATLALFVSAQALGSLPPRGEALSGNAARIRVRLAEAAPAVRLRGMDLRFASRPAIIPAASLAADSGAAEGSGDWELRCQRDRIRAVNATQGKAFDFRSPVSVASPAGFVQFRGRPYREEIRVHAVGSFCEVINVTDLEKYLAGLVNSEFSSRWNEESVSAQVVAARTYALYQIHQSRDLHFDLDATVRDQVYDGSMKEDFRAAREVERTRGLVLTIAGKDGVPLKAFYHSTCGGKTELPENVWGAKAPGFRRTVPCPFCAGSPVLRWRLELSGREIATAILRGARGEDARPAGWPKGWQEILRDGRLLGLRVLGLGQGGRAAEIASLWELRGVPHELKLSGVKLRDWIGTSRFRSASFEIAPSPLGHGFSFRGKGNGHGVGMCQYGAKAMGERGFKMAGILKHYYPDAILRKLW